MSIRVELELDDGSFTSRVLHAGETLRQFERNVGQGYVSVQRLDGASKGFLGTLRDVTAIAGLAGAAFHNIQAITTGWVADIVKVNAEMERLTSLMKSMSTSANPMKEAADQVKYLRDFAKQAPFSLQTLSDTFVKMKATGIDPTTGALKSLTDGVAAFGGTDETLKRATIAITQMSGKGVIQMEELRQQLGEAMPRATELMARAMGVTMDKLIKDIGTGTVQSKEALAALAREIDRTYGGAAAEQMKTFTGMLAQTRTLFQDLAVKTGEAGFFEAVKKQLADLNNFLAGPAASRFAETLGRGLTSIVGWLREGVEWLGRMSTELIAVAKYFAMAFALNLAGATLSSLVGLFQNMTTQVTMLRAAYAGLASQAAMTQVGVAIGQLGIAGAGISRTTQAVTLLGAALPVVAAGFGAVMSVVMPLGVAIAAVALTFGLFSDKTKEAWQNLEKFGATSRKQIADASELLKIKQQEIDALKKRRDLESSSLALPPEARANRLQNLDRQISEKESQLADMRLKLDKFAGDADRIESASAGQRRAAELDEMLRSYQRTYDERGRLAAEAQKKEMDRLAKEKKSTADLEERYQKETKERALALYDEKLAMLQLAYEAEQEIILRGQQAQRQDAQAAMDAIMDRMKTLREQRDLMAKQDMGSPMSQKALNEEKLYEKAKQALEKLNAEIAGNRAELAGASNEAAKLAYELEQMAKFGPVDNPKIAGVIAQLKQAQTEAEKLQELVEGKTKFERDLQNLKIKAQQELFAAQTAGKNDLDKFIVAFQQGFYKGMGPSSAETTISGVKTSLEAATVAAARAADTFRNALFGKTTMSLADQFIAKLKEIAGIFTGIQTSANGVRLPDVGPTNFSSRDVSGGGAFVTGGAKDPVATELSNVARALLNAIAGPESGGRYNIRYTQGGGATFDDLSRHPRIFEPGPHGPSSAAGRYQITATTFDRMGGGAFDAASQDRMAWKLAQEDYRARTGGNLEVDLNTQGLTENIIRALSPTWEGLKRGADGIMRNYEASLARYQGKAPYTPRNENDPRADINALPQEYRGTAEEIARVIQQTNELKNDNALTEKVKEIAAQLKAVGDSADGSAKRVTKMREMIAEGEFGADKDPDSKRYERLMKLVADLDKAEEQAALRKKLRQQMETGSLSRARDEEILNQRIEDLKRRNEENGQFKFSNQYYDKVKEYERMNQAAQRSSELPGGITPAERDALLQSNAEVLRRYRELEISEAAQAEQKKTREIERSTMTAADLRRAEHEEQIRRYDELLRNESLTADQRVMIERERIRRVNALRQQEMQQSPVGRMFKQWGDWSENWEKTTVSALDNISDGLAELAVKGTIDLKSLGDAILKDIARVTIRFLMSKALMGGKGAGAGGGANKIAGATGGANKLAGATGGAGKLGFREGGRVRGPGTSTSDSIPAWLSNDEFVVKAAATKKWLPLLEAINNDQLPKFAAGGLVRDHEKAFAKASRHIGATSDSQKQAYEQAGATGGGFGDINVTVNAAGGTPEQNEDLAARIGEQFRREINGMVDQRLLKSMRPGGLARKAMG